MGRLPLSARSVEMDGDRLRVPRRGGPSRDRHHSGRALIARGHRAPLRSSPQDPAPGIEPPPREERTIPHRRARPMCGFRSASAQPLLLGRPLYYEVAQPNKAPRYVMLKGHVPIGVTFHIAVLGRRVGAADGEQRAVGSRLRADPAAALAARGERKLTAAREAATRSGDTGREGHTDAGRANGFSRRPSSWPSRSASSRRHLPPSQPHAPLHSPLRRLRPAAG